MHTYRVGDKVKLLISMRHESGTPIAKGSIGKVVKLTPGSGVAPLQVEWPGKLVSYMHLKEIKKV